MASTKERLLILIQERPGLSERELAEAMLGKGAEQQRVNQYCRALVTAGTIERRGLGGGNDPFRYYSLGLATKLPQRTAPEAACFMRENNYIPEATAEWFWEGNVVDAIVKFLGSKNWKIENVADTHSKQQGVDIHACRHGRTLLVEAKGYPSVGYRDPSRAAERKRTSPTSQAQHWYSHALLKAMRLQSKYPAALVAMGLPDFERYRTLFQETRLGLEKLGIGLISVREGGNVSVWGAEIL